MYCGGRGEYNITKIYCVFFIYKMFIISKVVLKTVWATENNLHTSRGGYNNNKFELYDE